MTPRDRVALAARVGLPTALVACAMLLLVALCAGLPCLPLGLRYGVWTDRCPASDLRLDVQARVEGARRGAEGGFLEVTSEAHWMVGQGADSHVQRLPMRRGLSYDVELRDAAGHEVPGEVEVGSARATAAGLRLPIVLPAVPDGDYLLRVHADAGFEEVTVDVPLPVYASAVAHVLTDRPLYRPGQEVLLRSVVFRQADLAPVEERPGKWTIIQPDGAEIYTEEARSGPWGIASTSFPLDEQAATGKWTVSYTSGDATDAVDFEVRPFQLARGAFALTPARSWFTAGDALVVEGAIRYSSGAPLAGVTVQATLTRTSGRWPAPTEWEGTRRVRAGADGRFRLDYGMIPADLVERAVFELQVSAADATGETIQGQAEVVLSRESLLVDALTEFGGLVEGANNRVYLRVATPDGRPLRSADVVVYPDSVEANGLHTTTDEDGVASVQLSPGAPVTIVAPEVPVRPRVEAAAPPVLARVDRVGDQVAIGEQRALDALVEAVGGCRSLVIGSRVVQVGLQVNAFGRAVRVVTDTDPASRCVGRVVARVRMPPGDPRTFNLEWEVPGARLPWLEWRNDSVFGDAEIPFEEAGMRARACFRAGRGVEGAAVVDAHWSTRTGSRVVRISPVEHRGHGLSAAAMACLRRELSSVYLDAPAPSAAMGVASAQLVLPKSANEQPASPSTRAGYELRVEATAGGAVVASGTGTLDPGVVPPLRLRADPALAAPGETVQVDLLRGPGFEGELPDELVFLRGADEVARAPVTDNRAVWTVPADARGFVQAAWGGARAVVFVRDPAPLTVELAPSAATYRPGEEATLLLTTRAGGAPTRAAVGLVGVDEALGRLAPLPGADDLARVTVRARADAPAFGAFDPRALALGQIRGDNAARAAVLRVNDLPVSPVDVAASGAADVRAQTDDQRVTNFLRALDRATSKVRAWEGGAKPGDQLPPERMAALWAEALDELAREGAPAIDGYGRPLTLGVLPPELLALTDPRVLVRDATHLPEDFVGWPQFVASEVR